MEYFLRRDLSDNRIDSLHGKPFKGLSHLHDLLLSYNEVATIPYDAFVGIPKLQSLYALHLSCSFKNLMKSIFCYRDLEGNNINFVHEDSFVGFLQLEDL